jgi:hypothetical protein
MNRLARVSIVALSVCGWTAALLAQRLEPGATHRVFLKNGQALPSYGESVLVDDRIVFTLLVAGTAGRSAMQLMSLPTSTVDVERTSRYTQSMRAAVYAATRGEADYAAVTEEVQRALDQLKTVEDPKKRLEVAEEARRRLLAWSEEHYRYRATDVRELSGLFDEVIAELRVAAGETQLSLDLRSGPADPVYERVSAPPGLRESVALALGAALVTDVGEDRVAVLRAVAVLLERESGVDDLRASVKLELGAEEAADNAYAALSTTALASADAAMRRGDIGAFAAVRATVAERDRALGGRRPLQIASLFSAIEAKLEATRAYRLALDHHAYIRRELLAYEQRVRPALSTLDGLKAIIGFIREMKSLAYERLERADRRLQAAAANLAKVTPPPDLAQVHATLVSTLHMAVQATSRRRLAVATLSMPLAREASTAAAGAEMLFAETRELLVKKLFPPKFDDR